MDECFVVDGIRRALFWNDFSFFVFFVSFFVSSFLDFLFIIYLHGHSRAMFNLGKGGCEHSSESTSKHFYAILLGKICVF